MSQQNDSEIVPAADSTSTGPTQRELFEQARTSRRHALKKLGLTAGASAAMLFSESFVRLVAGKLADRENDQAYADTFTHGLRETQDLITQHDAFVLKQPAQEQDRPITRGRRIRVASSSAPASSRAALLTPTITVAMTPNPITPFQGPEFTIHGTVTGSRGPATGTMQITGTLGTHSVYSDPTLVAGAFSVVGQVATFISFTGFHTLQVAYPGDSVYASGVVTYVYAIENLL